MADRVDAQAESIAEVLQKEQGKSIANARGEVAGTALWLRLTAGIDVPTEVLQDDDNQRIELRRH